MIFSNIFACRLYASLEFYSDSHERLLNASHCHLFPHTRHAHPSSLFHNAMPLLKYESLPVTWLLDDFISPLPYAIGAIHADAWMRWDISKFSDILTFLLEQEDELINHRDNISHYFKNIFAADMGRHFTIATKLTYKYYRSWFNDI